MKEESRPRWPDTPYHMLSRIPISISPKVKPTFDSATKPQFAFRPPLTEPEVFPTYHHSFDAPLLTRQGSWKAFEMNKETRSLNLELLKFPDERPTMDNLDDRKQSQFENRIRSFDQRDAAEKERLSIYHVAMSFNKNSPPPSRCPPSPPCPTTTPRRPTWLQEFVEDKTLRTGEDLLVAYYQMIGMTGPWDNEEFKHDEQSENVEMKEEMHDEKNETEEKEEEAVEEEEIAPGGTPMVDFVDFMVQLCEDIGMMDMLNPHGYLESIRLQAIVDSTAILNFWMDNLDFSPFRNLSEALDVGADVGEVLYKLSKERKMHHMVIRTAIDTLSVKLARVHFSNWPGWGNVEEQYNGERYQNTERESDIEADERLVDDNLRNNENMGNEEKIANMDEDTITDGEIERAKTDSATMNAEAKQDQGKEQHNNALGIFLASSADDNNDRMLGIASQECLNEGLGIDFHPSDGATSQTAICQSFASVEQVAIPMPIKTGNKQPKHGIASKISSMVKLFEQKKYKEDSWKTLEKEAFLLGKMEAGQSNVKTVTVEVLTHDDAPNNKLHCQAVTKPILKIDTNMERMSTTGLGIVMGDIPSQSEFEFAKPQPWTGNESSASDSQGHCGISRNSSGSMERQQSTKDGSAGATTNHEVSDTDGDLSTEDVQETDPPQSFTYSPSIYSDDGNEALYDPFHYDHNSSFAARSFTNSDDPTTPIKEVFSRRSSYSPSNYSVSSAHSSNQATDDANAEDSDDEVVDGEEINDDKLLCAFWFGIVDEFDWLSEEGKGRDWSSRRMR